MLQSSSSWNSFPISLSLSLSLSRFVFFFNPLWYAFLMNGHSLLQCIMQDVIKVTFQCHSHQWLLPIFTQPFLNKCYSSIQVTSESSWQHGISVSLARYFIFCFYFRGIMCCIKQQKYKIGRKVWNYVVEKSNPLITSYVGGCKYRWSLLNDQLLSDLLNLWQASATKLHTTQFQSSDSGISSVITTAF